MSRKRAAWEAWRETDRMGPQRARPRGLPGGSFPEGWEFFQPARQAIWFAREEKSADKNMREWRVCGLLPCKVPLDAEFDEKRRHRRDMHSMLNSEGSPSEPDDKGDASLDSSCSITAKERSRSSSRRYFAAWHAQDIPFILGSNWAEGEEISLDLKSNIVLVINLCATERYYAKSDFLSQNIDYCWLKIEGGGRVPKLSELEELRHVFTKHFDSSAITVRAKDESELRAQVKKRILMMPMILIHCTHGVNRTGFCAVVLAMLHSKALRVHEALSIFGVARGHYINRVELTEGLSAIFDNEDELEGVEREDGIVFVVDQ